MKTCPECGKEFDPSKSFKGRDLNSLVWERRFCSPWCKQGFHNRQFRTMKKFEELEMVRLD